MDERSWAERLAAAAALDDPLNRRLYELVAGSSEAVGRDTAAGALGLPRSTAALRLDRLADVGLLSVEFRRLSGREGPGAGRPAKLYRGAGTDLLVSVPERRYELIGELLADGVDQADRTDRPLSDVLSERARAIGHGIGSSGQSLWSVLDRYGYAPRLAPDLATDPTPDWEPGAATQDDQPPCLLLGNCPFQLLAARHRRLICGLNLDLLLGIVAGRAEADQHGPDAVYQPVSDPSENRCCVRLTPETNRTATDAGAPAHGCGHTTAKPQAVRERGGAPWEHQGL